VSVTIWWLSHLHHPFFHAPHICYLYYHYLPFGPSFITPPYIYTLPLLTFSFAVFIFQAICQLSFLLYPDHHLSPVSVSSVDSIHPSITFILLTQIFHMLLHCSPNPYIVPLIHTSLLFPSIILQLLQFLSFHVMRFPSFLLDCHIILSSCHFCCMYSSSFYLSFILVI